MLILLALSPAAHGQSISKCKHPRTDAVAYSSSPCPSTEAGWNAEFEGTGDARDRDRMTAAQAQASVTANQRYLADLGAQSALRIRDPKVIRCRRALVNARQRSERETLICKRRGHVKGIPLNHSDRGMSTSQRRASD
ncbi:hypothetical protein MNQ95_14640 [Pseudoxanthomonas daejeonensis]|uniref:hypothetical protein n=1 Tax=Pseudoxanthomonas daejeonensis TaxID=266062 RepID=UPI001F5420BB|nr:hypothetical protein [Pseudoxanthomonas daejeonensis]UNK57350.1 hypothetical protein MNQ95_14640 [Pseudoxanthomonas daejeonensis]